MNIADSIEKHYPVVVIGSGPAGMAAALSVAAYNVPVALFDEAETPGGQIYRNIERAPLPLKVMGKDYYHGLKLVQALRAANVSYFPKASVWNIEAGNTLGIIYREKSYAVKAQQIIICTGAMERPMPFVGWTLPGVMNAGAGQILLKSGALAPNEGVVLAGSGPLLMMLAWQYLQAGCQIDGILDCSPRTNRWSALKQLPAALRCFPYFTKAAKMLTDLYLAGVKSYSGVTELQAVGEGALAQVRFKQGEQTQAIRTPLLLTHFGVIPNMNLSLAAGCQHHWSESQLCWKPELDDWFRASVPGIAIAGDGNGIGGAIAASYEGELAGLAALAELGEISRAERDRQAIKTRKNLQRQLAIRPFLEAYFRPDYSAILSLPEQTTICRCEEVSLGDIRAANRQGAFSCNQLKAYTRCGMGPCQGRQCGTTVSWLSAQQQQAPMDNYGYYHIRPPVKPITLGQLAAMDTPSTIDED